VAIWESAWLLNGAGHRVHHFDPAPMMTVCLIVTGDISRASMQTEAAVWISVATPSNEPRRSKSYQRPVVTTRYPNERTWSVMAYLSPSPDRSRSAFV
jgi:hypothetical protein